ncbi:hypothetical protein B7W85_00240 [Allorhizobium ampelinum]|nr:hypothetical protein B7W85_00240 [Allorhizobium ampelinum]
MDEVFACFATDAMCKIYIGEDLVFLGRFLGLSKVHAGLVFELGFQRGLCLSGHCAARPRDNPPAPPALDSVAMQSSRLEMRKFYSFASG